MPDQFVVPQFLDVETKIIGPVTGRQFVILIVVAILEFIIYKLVSSLLALLGFGIPVLFVGIIFAFAKINGQPFHYLMLNMIQTFRKPGLRIWDKSMTDADIKEKTKKEKEKPEEVMPIKKLSQSHLSELSLTVNTGGVYKSQEDFYGTEK